MQILILGALAAAIAATPALAQETKVETRIVKKIVGAEGEKVDESNPEAARMLANCSGRKFETTAELQKDGKKRVTKFKLCATKNDDSSWLKTLEDAKAKIGANADLSAESKAKIVAELDAEIAKLHASMGH